MRFKLAQQEIRRYFEEDVRDVEDGERDVDLVALEMEVLLEAERDGVGDVNAVALVSHLGVANS